MQLAKKLQARRPPPTSGTDLDVPRSFVDFLAWGGITPSQGQAELARVAFDGAEPVDRPCAVSMFGDIDFADLPMGVRRVVVAVCGGRGGKTYLLIALRLVHGMLVRDLSPLAAGEEAFATVVAPNDDLRQQAVNYGLGFCRANPKLRPLLRLPKGTKPEHTTSEFGLYRADFDRVVTFTGAVATKGGYGVRGKWHTDLALDECAFFRDSTAKVNDKDIYEAGVSRVLPGGQVILGSTPWAKAGLLWEFYRDNWGKPDHALVARAPTTALNPLPQVHEVVELERKRNPENARREYDAEFMEAGTTVFFESTSVDATLTDEPFVLQPGDVVAAGADLGFRGDSSALMLVALRGNMLHVFDGREERPGDEPLKPSVTIRSFAECINGKCAYVMADGHYREAVAEHLEAHNLFYSPAPTQPVDTYVRARMLLREKRVTIHPLPFRDRLIQQMREVQGKPTAGGGMSIQHPRWATGGHGDLVAALVLAVWQVSGDVVATPPPTVHSREWEMQERARRRREFATEQNVPSWKRMAGAHRHR